MLVFTSVEALTYPGMSFTAPAEFQIADYFLDARVAEGRGARVALHTEERSYTYEEVQREANRYAALLVEAGVQPEQRVILSLRDGLPFVAALFGVLKMGGVVVMLNPELKAAQVDYFLDYTRARAAFVERDHAALFEAGAARGRLLEHVMVVDAPEFEARRDAAPATFENFPTHRDDAAIWLFSGGTTGKPKAVVQTHRSFAYTTECYGKQTLAMTEDDVTLSVPKLFFGYATGINLLFPFSITGLTAAVTCWIERAVLSPAGSGAEAGYALVATLTSLALLEHWLMVLPVRDSLLWRWMTPKPGPSGLERAADGRASGGPHGL